MTNANIYNYLIDNYNKVSYTHNYIFGFRFGGMIYMTIATSDILAYVLKLDKASRGAGYSLRFKPDKAQKALLLQNATPIMSTALFDEMVEMSDYNNGEIFEKVITERYGQVWTKDNVPFTEAGDIEVNGIAYQIKFEKATFTNEKSLHNLLTM